jgi:hypothetical protein
LLIKDGELNIDMTDDVVGAACVRYGEDYLHPRVAAALETAAAVAAETEASGLTEYSAQPGMEAVLEIDSVTIRMPLDEMINEGAHRNGS